MQLSLILAIALPIIYTAYKEGYAMNASRIKNQLMYVIRYDILRHFRVKKVAHGLKYAIKTNFKNGKKV